METASSHRSFQHDVPAWSCRAAKPSRWKRHELKAASLIREYRPHVIHARNHGAWIDAAFVRSVSLSQGKLAFTIHGWDRVSHMLRGGAACRWLAKMTDGMAAVSSRTANDFADETGIARAVQYSAFRRRYRPVRTEFGSFCSTATWSAVRHWLRGAAGPGQRACNAHRRL